MTTLEMGFTRLKAPPGVSAVGLPDSQVRVGEDGHVEVPDMIAAELVKHGFQVVATPRVSDEALDELRAERDELKTRLDDLEAEQASVATDGVEASARLEKVKVSLASAEASLDEVREAERAVEESRSRSVLIAEAVAVVLAGLSAVARRVSGEESIRETFQQTVLSEPLIEAAAENVEAFVAGIVMARDALADRAAILDKIAAEFPRVKAPTLTVAELGAAMQAALSDSAIERHAASAQAFTKFVELLIVGPVIALQSAEAQRRIAALKVVR